MTLLTRLGFVLSLIICLLLPIHPTHGFGLKKPFFWGTKNEEPRLTKEGHKLEVPGMRVKTPSELKKLFTTTCSLAYDEERRKLMELLQCRDKLSKAESDQCVRDYRAIIALSDRFYTVYLGVYLNVVLPSWNFPEDLKQCADKVGDYLHVLSESVRQEAGRKKAECGPDAFWGDFSDLEAECETAGQNHDEALRRLVEECGR